MRTTVIDTGPLVAAFDSRDQYHNLTSRIFTDITMPLITCEAVVVETCFLLSKFPDALQRFGNWLHMARIQVPFRISDESRHVFSLMKKYEDMPMSLADACLVVMVELNPELGVFTFDKHFQIYRTASRRVIKTVGLD
ncbi:MAG: PIN domain-containing protein [Verrucomicrobia bacterium]|nr:PIN domain-containing protein [Verrucomicrobiota bacterium]